MHIVCQISRVENENQYRNYYTELHILQQLYQGCHNGRFRMNITVQTSARNSVYPSDGFNRPQTR
jgi:hypothetical protein